MADDVLYQVSDRVARLTIDRPQRRNALAPATVAGLRQAVARADVGPWPFMITVPLVRAVPPRKALELMMTARRVGAEEAAQIGFVNRVVPVEELDASVDQLASELARRSPVVMKMGRDSFYATRDLAAAPALRQLHAQLSLATLTEDAAEGMAAFRERRPPRWAES